MRISRIVLPLLLLAALPACAAGGGAASASSPAAVSPGGAVELLNHDEMVRLMSARITPEMRSQYRPGYAVIEVELDAGGAVKNSRYVSAGGGMRVQTIGRELAPRMRFRPAVDGQRVLVRLAYDREGRPDVVLEQ